jgi:hypothetical protein
MKSFFIIGAVVLLSVGAQAQWTKLERTDEITNEVTTSFIVTSLAPERAELHVLCIKDQTHVALTPHFQVRADEEYHRVAIPMRIDDVATEIKGIVQGDLNEWVQVETGAVKILVAEKEIKVKLWEFGAGSHLMTFKLNGAVPDCPKKQ